MMFPWLKTILRLIFLVLLQGLIVNRLDLWQGYMLPWVYIFGLLMMPLEAPRTLRMLIGFLTGLAVDMFTNTAGVHASASVCLTFAQPFVLKALSPREGYDSGLNPTIQDMGVVWYITYASLLALVHHVLLFFLELWRFTPFFSTLGKALFSALATVVFMVLGQYLIFSQDRRRK
jgi:hypothetical protein